MPAQQAHIKLNYSAGGILALGANLLVGLKNHLKAAGLAIVAGVSRKAVFADREGKTISFADIIAGFKDQLPSR